MTFTVVHVFLIRCFDSLFIDANARAPGTFYSSVISSVSTLYRFTYVGMATQVY